MHYRVLCAVVLLLFPLSDCVKFDVPTAVKQCIYEEYSGDTLVKGKFSSPQVDQQTRVTLEVTVSDSSGTELHSGHTNQGTFAFTTGGAGGVYFFCFRHNPEPGERLHYSYNRRVTLELESGVDTTDFGQIPGRSI